MKTDVKEMMQRVKAWKEVRDTPGWEEEARLLGWDKPGEYLTDLAAYLESLTNASSTNGSGPSKAEEPARQPTRRRKGTPTPKQRAILQGLAAMGGRAASRPLADWMIANRHVPDAANRVSQIAYHVKACERHGWVERTGTAGLMRVNLTDQGRDLLERLRRKGLLGGDAEIADYA